MMPAAMPSSLAEFFQEVGFALEPAACDLQVVELFAGTYNLCKSCNARGFVAMPFDKRIRAEENILDHYGFQLALQYTLRLQEGGLLWAGVECSTWVFMSRATFLRSAKCPQGDTGNYHVRLANTMAERTALLCHIAAARGCKIVIENPLSSLLWKYEPMATLVQRLGLQRTLAHLGSYGAPTAKPVLLYSNWPAAQKLKTERPVFSGEETVSLVKRNKDGSVTGLRNELKESQEYPAGFTDAVAMLLEDPTASLKGTKRARLWAPSQPAAALGCQPASL